MKNILYKSLLVLGTVGGIITGCTKTTEEYVSVDTSAFTFMAEPDGYKTIKIESNPGWDVDIKNTESWLKVVETTKDALILSADMNDSGAHRFTTITINAGKASRLIKIDQNVVEDGNSARYRLMSQFLRTVISPNGKLAGGFITGFDEQGMFVFTPIIIDIETDEWFELGQFPQTQFILQDAICISDDGQLFLSDGDAGTTIRFSREETGDFETLELTEKDENGKPLYISKPSLAYTGDGGKIWVGYAMKSIPGKDNQYFPIKWVNGVAEELPRPEFDFRGEPFSTGVMARGCSADGSVIYGTSWENSDNGMVYWKDGKVDYVCRENVRDSYFDLGGGVKLPYKLVDGMIAQGAAPYNASATGKYLCGTYRFEEMNEEHTQVNRTGCPAFFNTETKEIYKLSQFTGKLEAGGGAGSALFALDNGIGFIGTPYYNCMDGIVVDIETQAVIGTVQDWILEKYGISIPNGVGYINFVSPDESIMFGTRPISLDFAPGWYVAPPLNK